MKTRTKIAAWLLAFAMVFSTAFVPASAAKVKVKKVTVASSVSGSKKTVVVAKGKSVKLTTTVTVTPNKKANKAVSYSVKDKKIATVNNKGVVKGKKAGTTKVTVTSKKNKKKKATITVKVVKGAVTSVKLNKSKASLNLGQTLKLKATVKAAKGANKTLAYTSSNAKVAKVSSKGVVSAVGVGSATITAKAIDGSGKKATCTVKVANPINLAGMNIPNERTVTFALDKACALAPSQVSIAKKIYVSGNYNNQLVINNMTTADNVNYTVVLSDDTGISVGDFVQVAIPSLTGTTKSLEMEYKEQLCAFTGESISRWTVGTYSSDEFTFGSGCGYSSYSLNGLPAGLTYEVKNDYVKVKGTPTTPGTYDFVLSAVDELGNTLTRTIHFIIGSDTVIAAAANASYSLIGTDETTTYKSISVTGGSGRYNYAIVSDPLGTSRIDDDDDVRMTTAAAGVYTVVVRVTDAADASRAVDVNVVWNVKQGISVGGCVKDAQGNPMKSATVYFENKDRASRYCTEQYASMVYGTSTYSAILEPGVYDIRAYYNGGDAECSNSTTYLYSQSLTATQTGYDIQLKDLYKVTLATSDSSLDIDRTWYVNHESVGYDSTLYLKPGTYALETSEVTSSSTVVSQTGDWWNGQTTVYAPYKLAAAVTVVNAAVQVPVTKVASGVTTTVTRPAAKETSDTISVGEYEWLYYSDSYAFRFIPSESGQYELSNSDVYLYNMDGTKVASVDDVYTLTENTNYIVGCGSYNNYSIKITKVTSQQ